MAAVRTPPPSRRRNQKKNRLGTWSAVVALVLTAAYLGTIEASRPHVGGDLLRFDQFVDQVEAGRVDSAKLLDIDSYVVGTYRPEGEGAASKTYNVPYLKARSSTERVIDLLLGADVPTTIDQQDSKRLLELLRLILPLLILLTLGAYFLVSMLRGTGPFAVRSSARKLRAEDANATFADVAGQDAAVAELREIRDFLADPTRFATVGASIPKGILLFGPPGCGKTLMARALAGEAGASFFSISGSDFMERFVGVGAARVRDLFEKARESTPALIFIDELDSIGRSRIMGGNVAVNTEQEQSLNQILAEMDGFSPSDGIIVLAATNRPDILDPALLRPGRFDRSVGLELPDEAGRLAILTLHATGKVLDEDVDLSVIANRAIGMTGADLANVLNEAALLAARAERTTVAQEQLEEALKRTLEAPERQRRLAMRARSVGKRSAVNDKVTFADVAGVDDAIEELSEIKSYLAEPSRYLAIGARVPRGILLSGPPGCGKTLLARAVAGEANAAFFSASASEFVEIWVGQGAARVRDLFAEARSVAPSIVFLDELDAIGGQRGGGPASGGGSEREATLNQILVELDGFDDRSAVIVMAATNRPDMLDSALVRPGRFDRQVEITLPDRAGRRAILDVHARGKRLGTDVELDVVASLTQGFSGADLANVLNEAALLAARRGATEIPMSLVEEGVDRAGLGVASRGTTMSEEERRLVAYHEAGHALVARAYPGSLTLHKVTITPRGRALGHNRFIDDTDRVVLSRNRLLERMAGQLGGRAAELLVLGDVSSSASGDLQAANNLAQQMVRFWGMSDAIGAKVFIEDPRSADPRGWSERAASTIDSEVARMVAEAGEVATTVLTACRRQLDQLAEALLEQETLTAAEIEKIVGPVVLPPAG
ncbi:MAG: AAA family ATPase [Acidimicrobiales bacterium]